MFHRLTEPAVLRPNTCMQMSCAIFELLVQIQFPSSYSVFALPLRNNGDTVVILTLNAQFLLQNILYDPERGIHLFCTA